MYKKKLKLFSNIWNLFPFKNVLLLNYAYPCVIVTTVPYPWEDDECFVRYLQSFRCIHGRWKSARTLRHWVILKRPSRRTHHLHTLKGKIEVSTDILACAPNYTLKFDSSSVKQWNDLQHLFSKVQKQRVCAGVLVGCFLWWAYLQVSSTACEYRVFGYIH